MRFRFRMLPFLEPFLGVEKNLNRALLGPLRGQNKNSWQASPTFPLGSPPGGNRLPSPYGFHWCCPNLIISRKFDTNSSYSFWPLTKLACSPKTNWIIWGLLYPIRKTLRVRLKYGWVQQTVCRAVVASSLSQRFSAQNYEFKAVHFDKQ